MHMHKGRITIEVGNASSDLIAQIANDVWARLSDPAQGETIDVSVRGTSTVHLNRDWQARYKGAPDWR